MKELVLKLMQYKSLSIFGSSARSILFETYDSRDIDIFIADLNDYNKLIIDLGECRRERVKSSKDFFREIIHYKNFILDITCAEGVHPAFIVFSCIFNFEHFYYNNYNIYIDHDVYTTIEALKYDIREKIAVISPKRQSFYFNHKLSQMQHTSKYAQKGWKLIKT